VSKDEQGRAFDRQHAFVSCRGAETNPAMLKRFNNSTFSGFQSANPGLTTAELP